jgi:hypothetical protein
MPTPPVISKSKSIILFYNFYKFFFLNFYIRIFFYHINL